MTTEEIIPEKQKTHRLIVSFMLVTDDGRWDGKPVQEILDIVDHTHFEINGTFDEIETKLNLEYKAIKRLYTDNNP